MRTILIYSISLILAASTGFAQMRGGGSRGSGGSVRGGFSAGSVRGGFSGTSRSYGATRSFGSYGGYGYRSGGYGYRGGGYGYGGGLGFSFGFGSPGYYAGYDPWYYDPYYYDPYYYTESYYRPVVIAPPVAVRPAIIIGGHWRHFGR